MNKNTTRHRKNAYDYEDLIISATTGLFGIGNAQLPTPPMLMFSRITHINDKGGTFGKGLVIAEHDIKPDLWFFKCHFKGDPVMPGCLGLDAMWQLLGFFISWNGAPGKGRALGVGDTKFTGQILPSTTTLKYTINIKRIIARDITVGIADGNMSIDDKDIYTTKNLRVALFQAVENF